MDVILGNNGDRYTLTNGMVYMNGLAKWCPTAKSQSQCGILCMHLNRNQENPAVLHMTCTGIGVRIRTKGVHES
jgi:hypothetical protein